MATTDLLPTILLVEDDYDIVTIVRLLLEDEGYAVATAGDGEDALTSLRSGLRPCLILLDMMMPRCDGKEFRRRQLADSALAAIPVVIITADAHIERKAGDLNSPYLAKPIRLDALLVAVRTYCRPAA